ncbi:MAG: hypothetical protein GX774_06915 [Armatimonadetes bacterium]|nr:hypothetical protein [Armatimonadota bacterium]
MVAVYILLVLMSPALAGIVFWFLLEWRKHSGGGKETVRLRQELEALRRDYAQLKADHTDMLLGLNAAVSRLDARLDQLTGIEEPAAEPPRQEPRQRQL